MSKYDALGEYLKRQRRNEVPMTFAEIEKITGRKLPASSRYRAWWSNNDFNSVLTKVWLAAGFRSEQVEMDCGKLVFRRVGRPKAGRQAAPAAGAGAFHPAYGALNGLIRVMPGTDLTQPADPDWSDRLDAQDGQEKREM